MSVLEEGSVLKIDFDKLTRLAAACSGLVPVAVQDCDTGEVILLAYTNELAFRKSIEERSLVLWSSSRNKLWRKGETSGETFDLVEARVNCEQNSLLYKVRPRRGGVCHTKNKKGEPRNCYYRRINMDDFSLENMNS